MKFFLVFAFVACAFGVIRSVQEIRDTTTIIAGDENHFRLFSAELTPSNAHPKNIALTGVKVDKNGDNKTADLDAVRFELNTTNEMSLGLILLKAEGEAANLSDVLNFQAFEFVVRAFAVFEFDDNNGVPGYQNGTSDELTGGYNLSHEDLQWKDLVVNSDEVDVNGTTIKIFYVTAETVDQVFLLRFVVVGAEAEIGGVKLTTESSKIDVVVRWFTEDHVAANWTTGPSNADRHPNASVGVLAAFAAAAESFTRTDHNEVLNNTNPTLNFVAGNATGFFSYETTAGITVQGEQSVGAVHADYSDARYGNDFNASLLVRIFWFSFAGARPEEVYWDPEFGAQSNEDSTPTSSSTSGSPDTGAASTGTHASTSGSVAATGNTSASVMIVPAFIATFIAFFFGL